jgi:NodT family efflux transporter outer membrane factor (OMF) lipoprotein
VAAATLLAGCAGLPAAPAPGPVTAETPAVADAWWAGFGDPLLGELITAARAASPTVASAGARIERARATRVAAGAALLPNLDALASGSAGRNAPEPKVTTTTATAGVRAGWEIDLFGRNAAGRDAAQARLEGARAGLADAHTAVAAETASSYLALRACEAQRAQTEIDAASREQTARLTAESERAGFTAPADTALARASAAQARQQLASQRLQCETLVLSLAEVTAIDTATLKGRLAARTAQLPRPAPLAVPEVQATRLAQRPDLIDSARAVAAAAAELRQQRAAELPQISLSGSIGATSVRVSGAGSVDSSRGATWSFGPLQVSFPLFDGGARSAATDAARAAYDEAVALYQAQLRRAVREIEVQLATLASTAEREADAAAAARDFEASLVATQARQRGGLASLFDLEAARRNAAAAQSALIELQRERAAAWIALHRSLGGGFDATAPLDRFAASAPSTPIQR